MDQDMDQDRTSESTGREQGVAPRHTVPSGATRAAERDEAEVTAGADRAPTPD